MATLHSPADPVSRKLANLERERKEEADARQAVWAFLWTVFAFKICTMAIIWYVAKGSSEVQALAISSSWYFLVIPAGALAGPVLYRWRLVKQRKRRQQLRDSEFTVHRN